MVLAIIPCHNRLCISVIGVQGKLGVKAYYCSLLFVVSFALGPRAIQFNYKHFDCNLAVEAI